MLAVLVLDLCCVLWQCASPPTAAASSGYGPPGSAKQWYSRSSEQYLLPLFSYGANNQLRGFKEAVVLSRLFALWC